MTVTQPRLQRNQNLDLLKWLAIFSMTIDHARYLIPYAEHFNYACYVLGRLAYPFFLLFMAHYFYRTRHQHHFIASDARYLKNLVIFAILSEIPFRIYFQDSCLNIFPTLILSFIILYGYVRQPRYAWLYMLIPALLICLLNSTTFMQIQYSWLGCFGILAFYIALIDARYITLVVLCAIVMNLYYMLELQTGMTYASIQLQDPAFYVWIAPVCIILSIGIPIAYRLQHLPVVISVPPIGKWAYMFYPLHIIVYCIIRYLLR